MTSHHAPHAKHSEQRTAKIELTLAVLAGVCVLASWILGVWQGGDEGLPRTVAIIAFILGALPTLRDTIASIRKLQLNIDFLMLAAAAGAAFLGEWLEGALLLFLFTTGHALETYSMGRARRAIEALAELAPEFAIRIQDGRQTEVAVDDLEVGDRILVKPDALIPADGFVAKGTSSVDQSSVTGESVPVDKRAVHSAAAALETPARVGEESAVFSGTMNGAGVLEVIVTRRSSESTLARVVKLVTEAETRQSPTQRFAEKFERVFVPSVLVLDVVIFVGGLMLGEPFHQAFYRAMAVMVAASPCALAISTPSAVLAGIATAGRSGVLVKGGGPLEVMGRINAIAFDKTGTLTEGRPRVTDIVPAEGADEAELVRMAVAMEMKVDHPIAEAVVRDLRDRANPDTLPELGEVQSMTGLGIRARLTGGDALHIGKLSYFLESDGTRPSDTLVAKVRELEAAGRSTMVVRAGERYLGSIGLMDTPRAAARETVARLRTLGIKRMVMLSGDNQPVADAIGRDVGIDEAFGNLMPEDKVKTVARLLEDGDIAMVGDGVNDAPAMATASVGIAMGAAGSDVALETADIALMGDDIAKLPFAVGLGRRTARIIKQNVFISLGMVAFLVPATIFGLDLGPAVVLHEGSTLVVVLNGLRLLSYK